MHKNYIPNIQTLKIIPIAYFRLNIKKIFIIILIKSKKNII